MTLSSLEHRLTYHIRTWLTNSFKWSTIHSSTFIISLFACISAGLLNMVSVYTIPWQLRLGYSSLDVNLISAAANLGAYLTPPILGVLSDSHGPVILSWLSFIGYVPSYLYLSHVFRSGHDPNFIASVVAFAVVGISTSSLYFGALVTCAKLYPDKKLLSISFPTTCFGISSLIGLQVLKLPFFHSKKEGYLDLGVVFGTFAVFYSFVFILTWISTSTISIMKLRLALAEEQEQEQEQEQCLGSEESPLLGPQRKKDQFYIKIRNFATDYLAYSFLAVMLLGLGVLEMFNTNMVNLSSLILGPESSYNVLTQFSIFSTCSRLVSGCLVDLFTKWQWPRITLIFFILSVAILAQVAIIHAMNVVDVTYLSIASAICGLSYGGLFTVFPSLTLNLWGDQVFGTAYGTFMLGPAMGSAFFGIAYARVHDSNCKSTSTSSHQHPNHNPLAESPNCIVPVFKISTAALSFAMGIILIATIMSKRLRNA